MDELNSRLYLEASTTVFTWLPLRSTQYNVPSRCCEKIFLGRGFYNQHRYVQLHFKPIHNFFMGEPGTVRRNLYINPMVMDTNLSLEAYGCDKMSTLYQFYGCNPRHVDKFGRR